MQKVMEHAPINLQRRRLLKKAAAFAAIETLMPEAQGQSIEPATLQNVPLGLTVKVTVEPCDQIVLLGINRPDIQNRIGPQIFEQLGSLL
jgi:hypothetical protein